MAAVYGMIQAASPAIEQALTALSSEGILIVRHGDLIATAFAACMAAIAAIAHVVIAFSKDNSHPDDGTTAPSESQ